VRRRLFNPAAAVSLGMMLAFVALCVRSYRRSDAVRVSGLPFARYLILYSGNGRVLFGVSPASVFPTGLHYRSECDPEPIDARAAWFDGWGFGAASEPAPYVVAARWFWMPHWSLALLLGVSAGAWLRRATATCARNGPGLCATCRYDLRATPERCPECGTPVVTAVTPKPAEATA
jgi:hypothetical protein